MAIHTIGSGGDFSSPRAWCQALPSTLTEPMTARIIDDLSTLSSVNLTFDINTTTSATNFITIETYDNSGSVLREQDFKGPNGDIPVITFGRGGTFGFVSCRAGVNHIVLRNLTVEATASSTNLFSSFRSGLPSDNFTIIHDCYFYPLNEIVQGGTIHSLESGTNGSIYNNIIVTAAGGQGIFTNGCNIDVYNNTVVSTFANLDVARTGIRYGNGAVERNAVFHFGPLSGNRDYLNKASTFNDNASSDSSGSSGIQNLVLTDQYTDPSNHDWSFKAGNSLEGGAGGQDIGVVLPSSGPSPIIPSFIQSTSVVFEPVILQDKLIIPETVSSTSVVYEPTIPANKIIAPDTISSVSQVFDPVILQDKLIQPVFTSSVSLVFQPTLLRALTISPEFTGSISQVFSPIVLQDKLIQPEFTGSVSQVFDPTLLQDKLIQPEFTGSISEVFDPSILTTKYINPEFTLSESVVYNHKVTGGFREVPKIKIYSAEGYGTHIRTVEQMHELMYEMQDRIKQLEIDNS